MIIKNGICFTDKGVFEKGDICIEGEYIVSEGKEDHVVDAEGLYVIPGLIDTHIHGAVGYDFCDNKLEAIKEISEYLLKQGITAFLPTSMSLKEEDLKTIFKTFKDYIGLSSGKVTGAMPLGIHMEGPFFDDAKKGAQNGDFLRAASEKLFKDLQNASGNHIKIVSLSPVVNGTLAFIENLKDEVVISIGHTTADYELERLAFHKGARRVTHLYNGMISSTHRAPGVAGAAFDNEEVYVELICDGIHVHPSIIRSTFAMYTDNRVVLISDNIRATGMKNGIYELGGQNVSVEDNKAILLDGTIAGSVTNLMDGMRQAVNFGVPLTSAIKAVTMNPAKSIGVYEQMGSLTAGKLANLVLLDEKLNIKGVYLRGVRVI